MTIRLVAIILILAAASAIGMIAYRVAVPPGQAHTAVAEVPRGGDYFVAAHPLSVGTLLRDDDFVTRKAPPSGLPEGAIADGPDIRTTLRGALVRHYIDAGAAVTLNDILRPRDRGYLASVLAPGTRGVTVGVDAVTGVAGLISPGDLVDVILTQMLDDGQATPAKRVLSETVLTGMRVIAVDQDIVQGARAPVNGATPTPTRTVTLQATADEAERLRTAQQLGRLALAVRAVGDAPATNPAPVYGGDVSLALSRLPDKNSEKGAKIQVIEGANRSEVTFK